MQCREISYFLQMNFGCFSPKRIAIFGIVNGVSIVRYCIEVDLVECMLFIVLYEMNSILSTLRTGYSGKLLRHFWCNIFSFLLRRDVICKACSRIVFKS